MRTVCHLFWAVASVVALGAVCGCGSDAESKPEALPLPRPADAEIEAAIADLVPADTVVLVRARSVAAFVALQDLLAEATGAAAVSNPAQRLAWQTGLEPADLDVELPVVLALSVSASRPLPMVTYVLPVRDATAARERAQLPRTAAHGRYVGLSVSNTYSAGGGSALVRDLADVDFLLRVDLDRLVASWRAPIEMQLNFLQARLKETLPDADLAALFGQLREWIDGAETFDLALRRNGRRVDIDAAYTARAGSPLAQAGPSPRLDTLAGGVRDAPLLILCGIDLEPYLHLWPWAERFLPRKPPWAAGASWEESGPRVSVAGDATGGAIPARLQKALARTLGDPRLVVAADLRATLRLARAWGARVGEVPDGDPVLCEAYVARAGRVVRAGLSFDPGQVGPLLRSAR